MDPTFLARLQFAFTVGFHYLFPPMSIGLGLLLIIMEGLYLKTGKPVYQQMTRFWVKIFGLIFALGVASGIVMEFQFGTNWSGYSRYVGDVFGSALAAEGVFAFFLESGFLALLLFGWNRVSPKIHFLSTVMVGLGAHLSALWIIVANSWQQTPAGHHIVQHGAQLRAEITDFWGLVFNPSTMERFNHTIVGAWQEGSFFVLSVAAFYILRNKHQEMAKAMMKIGLVVALVASLLQLVTGHSCAQGVSRNQPAKLAAFEGHFEKSAPGDMYILGWVNDKNESVSGLKIPGLLSFLVHWDTSKPLTGLRAYPPDERPPVNVVFQSYHLMIMIGMGFIFLSMLGTILWWRGTLFQTRWLLWLFVLSVAGPQIANQVGWITAEVGRQPWIVYGLLKTSEAVSPHVSAGEILASLIGFGLIYLLLFFLYIYLLTTKILHGPEAIAVMDPQREQSALRSVQ